MRIVITAIVACGLATLLTQPALVGDDKKVSAPPKEGKPEPFPVLQTLKTDDDFAAAIAFSLDGKVLAVAGGENKTDADKLPSTPPGLRLVASPIKHPSAPKQGIDLRLSGGYLVTCGEKYNHFWDLKTYREVTAIPLEGNPTSATPALDGEVLVGGISSPNGIGVIERKTGRVLHRWPAEGTWWLVSLGGRSVVTTEVGLPFVRLWDIKSGKELSVLCAKL